jgi:regulator of protease activity HflC (stomatin/prohibitin superfamily)
MKVFTIVPQQSKYIVERLGKYHKTLEPGFHLLIPFFDNVNYKINLKEQIIKVENQRAITKDNVALTIDGVVFFRIEDEVKASYNVENFTDGIDPSSHSSQTPCHDLNAFRARQDRAEQRLSVEKRPEREGP